MYRPTSQKRSTSVFWRVTLLRHFLKVFFLKILLGCISKVRSECRWIAYKYHDADFNHIAYHLDLVSIIDLKTFKEEIEWNWQLCLTVLPFFPENCCPSHNLFISSVRLDSSILIYSICLKEKRECKNLTHAA